MYECFHCGHRSVIWQADFSYEDFGLEGEGIVQFCKCSNCGADIYYHITLTEEDIEEVQNGSEA